MDPVPSSLRQRIFPAPRASLCSLLTDRSHHCLDGLAARPGSQWNRCLAPTPASLKSPHSGIWDLQDSSVRFQDVVQRSPEQRTDFC